MRTVSALGALGENLPSGGRLGPVSFRESPDDQEADMDLEITTLTARPVLGIRMPVRLQEIGNRIGRGVLIKEKVAEIEW